MIAGVITDPHDLGILELLTGRKVLDDGKEVAERLRGMHMGGGHAVEYRHGRPLGKLDNALMALVSYLDGVNHAGEDKRGVL